MQKTCPECGAQFDVSSRKNARKFCDAKCRERHRHREASIAAGTYKGTGWPPRLDVCLHCGGDMSGIAPNARYCGKKCRMVRARQNEKTHRHESARSKKGWGPGSLINCKLDGCIAIFETDGIRKFCSPEHLKEHYRSVGMASADGTWTFPCIDCSEPAKFKRARRGRCATCRVKHDRAKARRKGANLLTVHEIAERDGTRCHICRKPVDMSLGGNHQMGPTVEHIVCRTWDGFDPSDPYNEVLAHRTCNTWRGNRKPSQMVLAF